MKKIMIGFAIGLLFIISCSSKNENTETGYPYKTDGIDDPNEIVYSIVVKDVNGVEYTIYTSGTIHCYIKERKIQKNIN